MRKHILSFLIILLLLCCHLYSKDFSAILKKYVDSSYKNIDFILQNPTFYNPSDFYSDIKDVKGKVIKRTSESYTVNDNGNKIYGDSDIREYQTDYYVFDSNGHITDRYFISLAEDGYVFSKLHSQYYYSNDKYLIKTHDMKNNSESIEEYSISEENDQLIFSKSMKKNEYKIVFNHNNIQYQIYKNGIKSNETIYHLNNDFVVVEKYKFDNSNRIKNNEETYSNGAVISKITYLNDGSIKSKTVYEINDKENFVNYFVNENGKFIKKSVKKLERKYKSNLLIDDNILPVTEKGEYNIMHTEILSKYDSFYSKWFK